MNNVYAVLPQQGQSPYREPTTSGSDLYVIHVSDLRLSEAEMDELKSRRHKITVLINRTRTILRLLFRHEEPGCFFRLKVRRGLLRHKTDRQVHRWLIWRLRHYL